MVEILILNLKPGIRDQFHSIYIAESLPLQKNWNIKVVAHGPSPQDENSYFVIRFSKVWKTCKKAKMIFMEVMTGRKVREPLSLDD